MAQSGLSDASPADRVDVAVVWVEKAKSMSKQWTDCCSVRQLRAYRLKKQLKPLMTSLKYVLLLMAAFEEPSYCLMGSHSCDRPDMLTSRMFTLSNSVSNGMAILIYLCFIMHFFLRKRALGDSYTPQGWYLFANMLVAIALCDNIVSIFNVTGIWVWSSFRISRLLRPFIFLGFTKSLREEATRVVRSIPGFVDVFLALIICLVFFTWAGIVFFQNSEEGASFFKDWGRATTSLWIFFTTANCPDVFVLAYTQHRISCLFFIAFMVISVYLLSNVLLARVYDSYKTELTDMVREHYNNRKIAIEHAFRLLANERGVIDRACFGRLFVCLCDSSLGGEDALVHSDDKQYNTKRAMQMFQAMDKDSSGGLDAEEFKQVLDVIHDSSIYIPKAPTRGKDSSQVKLLRSIFTEGIYYKDQHLISWDAVVDWVVLVDLLTLFCQTVLFESHSYKDVLKPAGLLGFSCFYVIVVSLKIYVLGFERFWNIHAIQNRFDFFNVYGIFIAELAALALIAHSHGNVPDWVAKTIILLHITRGLRFLQYIEPIRFIARFVVDLAPTYYRTGMLLFLIFYLYATVGQQWFGGLVYKSNPALKGTDYADSGYWAFNFSDFPSSMVTLFCLMVLNNWFVFAAAYVKVSGTQWAVAFFVSFFLIVNLTVLNILMAMILDCSAVVAKHMEDAENKDEEHGAKEYDYESVLKDVLLADEDLEDEVPLSPSQYPSPSQRLLRSNTVTGYGSTGRRVSNP
eukprot:TRINITY_DN7907_c0_g1_i2.p1 TRINITY_DN7907_c0_g1~~TRINITY_DN7907_c0_g1_i2.p1  ORF type:complete len:742 (+),score=108.15 TRINITY_DN7907_c0_g1_i2:83-2308(+)